MKSKIFIAGFLFLLALGLTPWVSLAAVTIDPQLYPKGAPVLGDGRPTEASQAREFSPDTARILLTQRIINVLLGMAGVVAIFFILNNAWFLMVGAGSEEKIGQHKKGITWAIVGLVFIILSYSIIRFIISIPFLADEAALNKPEASSGAASEEAP